MNTIFTCRMNGIPIFKYSIRNATDGSVDVFIDGDIVTADIQKFLEDFWGDDTTTSYRSFRDQLNAIEANVYNIYVNSGGGVVTEAMAIHDLLVDLQDKKGKTVNTIGRGIIASAATYILMAGKKPTMSANSWFMIHNVSGMAWGDVNQVEAAARTLRQFNDRSRDFYSQATGISKEEIENMMNLETWMTADEARMKGFIDHIDNEFEFTQAIPKEKWQFKNMVALNAYNSSCKPKPGDSNTDVKNFITAQNEDMKKFFQKLQENIVNAIKNVKAPENNDHQALMNSIGEVINNAFQTAGDGLDTEVAAMITSSIDLTKEGAFQTAFNTAVNAAISAALPSAVQSAVTTATQGLSEKVTNLEAANKELKEKNEQLEQEVANKLGSPTNGGSGEGNVSGRQRVGKMHKA